MSAPQRWQIGELISFGSTGVTRRTLLDHPAARCLLLCLKEGQELARHPAPGHAFVHVLSGRLEFTVGEDAAEVGRGALFYLPPGTPHRLRARRDSVVLVTVAAAGDGAAARPETK